MLDQFLDSQRNAVLAKTAGLNSAQLNQRLEPSALTLGGLLYHLALVEESWSEERYAGLESRIPWADVDWESDPDWEFHAAHDLDPEALRDRYRLACERSRAVAADASLDDRSVVPLRDGTHFSLRWMLLHLIEETARHAGHADLIREAIDGSVGD